MALAGRGSECGVGRFLGANLALSCTTHARFASEVEGKASNLVAHLAVKRSSSHSEERWAQARQARRSLRDSPVRILVAHVSCRCDSRTQRPFAAYDCFSAICRRVDQRCDPPSAQRWASIHAGAEFEMKLSTLLTAIIRRECHAIP